MFKLMDMKMFTILGQFYSLSGHMARSHHEETCLWGLSPGHAQTSLLSYRD